MSRCRRHGRARRKARGDGRQLAARIMSGEIGAQPGSVGRTIRSIVNAVGDDGVRACGELRRARLVFVSRVLVVRWPGASAELRSWLARLLRLSTPMVLRAIRWEVVS